MEEDRISIEILHEIRHFYACEEVQKMVWGMDDISVVPAHLLVTAQKSGGLVLGAFNAQRDMVGFLFGFLGTLESTPGDQGAALRLKHCSHMLGVLPEYQTKGIGYLLKLRQREHALAQGLDLVTWTYDPLESANANLNVCKLGVVCDTYLSDVYGEMTSALHVGLPTDRFHVEWWIASQRVTERIKKGGEKLSLDEALEKGAKSANLTTRSADGLLLPHVHDLSITAEHVLVEVPADIQSIKAADISLATEWRMQTREIFRHYFSVGYAMVEFISELREGQRRSYYVMKQGFAIS